MLTKNGATGVDREASDARFSKNKEENKKNRGRDAEGHG